MIELTQEQLMKLMGYAWWRGHETSRYTPNLRGSELKDCRELVKDFLEETDDGQ